MVFHIVHSTLPQTSQRLTIRQASLLQDVSNLQPLKIEHTYNLRRTLKPHLPRLQDLLIKPQTRILSLHNRLHLLRISIQKLYTIRTYQRKSAHISLKQSCALTLIPKAKKLFKKDAQIILRNGETQQTSQSGRDIALLYHAIVLEFAVVLGLHGAVPS